MKNIIRDILIGGLFVSSTITLIVMIISSGLLLVLPAVSIRNILYLGISFFVVLFILIYSACAMYTTSPKVFDNVHYNKDTVMLFRLIPDLYVIYRRILHIGFNIINSLKRRNVH